jgi:co-chaperonin GroES (HSP10)
MDYARMIALNGNVLVVDAAREKVSAGGIVLTDTVEADSVIEGEVISVSPFLLEDGKYMDPPTRVGQRVAYSKHAGAGNAWKGETDKKTYRLIKWNEILAVLV